MKSTEIIDLEKRTIKFGGRMAKARGSFHLLSIRGNLFALGGYYYDKGSNHLAAVEEFVEKRGTWKKAKNLSGKRSHYGGVAVKLDLVCG